MSNSVDLVTLNNHYHWILSSNQSFNMCLYDIDTLREGCSIGYGIDGYDLCRYLFPSSFFRGKPNPHHEVIHSTWDAFFHQTDGETTFGIISPFTVLELLATVEEKTSGRNLPGLIGQNTAEIRQMLEELSKGIRTLDEIDPLQKEVIKTLNNLATMTKKARQIIREGKPFEKLEELLTQGRIRLLDPILGEVSPTTDLSALLSYNQDNLARGLQYLNYKRSKTFSEHNLFYNTLDIYHYILFDNVEPLIKTKAMQAYISSSGILSRNSWLLTKYGKLPAVLGRIPKDWSARSSDVPNFLTKALAHFNRDIEQVWEFFDESAALTRVILRDLREIPELEQCIINPTARQELLQRNPSVKVRNKIAQAVLRFQHEYYRILVPEFKESRTSLNDVPTELDFDALYRWITNPETRSQEFSQIAKQVEHEVNALNLHPIDWKMYIAPLGDAAYEILKTFNSGLDI
jgi:hypothetical protein